MTQMNWRSAILIILCLNTLGCAGISRDIYYVPDSTSEGWNVQFLSGKDQTKIAGRPDRTELKYANDLFEIAVHSDYQNNWLWSPFLVPIIPSFGLNFSDHDVFLHLYVHLKIKDHSIHLDPSKWVLTVNGENVEYEGSIVGTTEDLYTKIKYPVRFSSVQRMRIHFGGFNKDGVEIRVPEIEIKKEKGSFRYWTFTL